MLRINSRFWIKSELLIPALMFVVYFYFTWSGSVAIIAATKTGFLRLGLDLFSVIFVLAVLMKRKFVIAIPEIFIWISFVCYYLISAFWRYDGGTPSLIGVIVCIAIMLMSDDERAKTYEYIKKFFVLMAVLGIICYFFKLLSVDIIPHTDIIKGNGVFSNYHIAYFVTNYYSLVRLCGLFEEPGMLGTFIAFILCAEDLNFKNIWNILLAAAGVLTFSLAFFLIIAIYYVLKNIQEPRKWILVAALIIFYIYVLPNISTGNVPIDTVIKRLTISASGIAGDNRTSARFDRLFEKTIHTGKVWFGFGKGYAEIYGTSETEGLASIKSYIVNFGIIGTTAMFLPMITGCKMICKNMKMYMYLAINVISLYQRPYLLQVPYFTMLICGLAYMHIKSGEKSDFKCNNAHKIRR